jgi:hypothetical protein
MDVIQCVLAWMMERFYDGNNSSSSSSSSSSSEISHVQAIMSTFTLILTHAHQEQNVLGKYNGV